MSNCEQNLIIIDTISFTSIKSDASLIQVSGTTVHNMMLLCSFFFVHASCRKMGVTHLQIQQTRQVHKVDGGRGSDHPFLGASFYFSHFRISFISVFLSHTSQHCASGWGLEGIQSSSQLWHHQTPACHSADYSCFPLEEKY